MLRNSTETFGPIFLAPITVPSPLRRLMSFSAPLQTDTGAQGRGSGTPTYARNSIATYLNPATNLITQVGANVPRFEANGYLSEGQRVNYCLYSDDFPSGVTAAAWVATNMTSAYTSVGADGIANHATRLTATAANATMLQSLTRASAARITSMWVKRVTGTGAINMTQDNGGTWTVVTTTTSWTRVSIPTATAANPIVGIRIVADTDAIDVQYFQHEEGAFISSAIPTVASAVTRQADSLSFVGAGNNPATVAHTAVVKVNNYAPAVAGFRFHLATFDVGNLNGFELGLSSTNNTSRLDINNNAGGVANFLGNNQTADTTYTLAVAVNTNDFQGYENGVSVGTDTAGTLPSAVNAIRVGDRLSGLPCFGRTASVNMFSSRLSGWELGMIK